MIPLGFSSSSSVFFLNCPSLVKKVPIFERKKDAAKDIEYSFVVRLFLSRCRRICL